MDFTVLSVSEPDKLSFNMILQQNGPSLHYTFPVRQYFYRKLPNSLMVSEEGIPRSARSPDLAGPQVTSFPGII